jgi:hypothetical protein
MAEDGASPRFCTLPLRRSGLKLSTPGHRLSYQETGFVKLERAP